MKGKNKLVPRLLGITKESTMRVDEKTKEVIQEWSLTNIKRWAASPKSFTLVLNETYSLLLRMLCCFTFTLRKYIYFIWMNTVDIVKVFNPQNFPVWLVSWSSCHEFQFCLVYIRYVNITVGSQLECLLQYVWTVAVNTNGKPYIRQNEEYIYIGL